MRTAEHRQVYRAVAATGKRGSVVAHGIEPCGGQLPDALGQWRAYNYAGRGRRASSIATWLARPCGPAVGMGLGGKARTQRGTEET